LSTVDYFSSHTMNYGKWCNLAMGYSLQGVWCWFCCCWGMSIVEGKCTSYDCDVFLSTSGQERLLNEWNVKGTSLKWSTAIRRCYQAANVCILLFYLSWTPVNFNLGRFALDMYRIVLACVVVSICIGKLFSSLWKAIHEATFMGKPAFVCAAGATA
jgi:hypothetical protein